MADGTRYIGSFANGLEEGQGVLVDEDGYSYEGTFREGKKDGLFVEKDKNGKVVRQRTYKKGRLESETVVNK